MFKLCHLRTSIIILRSNFYNMFFSHCCIVDVTIFFAYTVRPVTYHYIFLLFWKASRQRTLFLLIYSRPLSDFLTCRGNTHPLCVVCVIFGGLHSVHVSTLDNDRLRYLTISRITYINSNMKIDATIAFWRKKNFFLHADLEEKGFSLLFRSVCVIFVVP